MRNGLGKVLLVFILLVFCMIAPGTAGCEGEAAAQSAEKVIAGFEPLGDGGVVTVQYKLALVTLQKELPARLSVRLEGGTGYQSVPVTWKCEEDYDRVYDTYHFEPVLEGYTLAEGVQAPRVSVQVLGESVIPTFSEGEDNDRSEPPELILRQGRLLRGSDTPSSYNSFEAGRLPPVRNQDPYNSCWAFSSVGTMEADLISDGDAEKEIDLSELHLGYYAYHSYYDEKSCGVGDVHDYKDSDYMNAGGTQDLAISALSNMIGPASEETIPYTWGNDYQPSPFDGRAYQDVQLENAYILSGANTVAIKAAIQEHGAVSASVYWKNDYYSYTHNSYYCPRSRFTNHAIMLVGWDDHFSKDNFSGSTPSTDGAWLVRNSWGLNKYGREGYFWLSYADPSFLKDSVYVFDAVSSKYDHCYSYATVPDSLNDYKFTGSVTAVQHFMVDGGEQITAVGFETKDGGFDVQIELTLGAQKAYASTSVEYPGYYTLELNEPIIVTQRSDVTLKMEYEGEEIRIFTEYAGTTSSEYSTVICTGYCGSGGLILNDVNTGEDGLIKLFTVDCDVPGEEGVRINAANFPDNAFRNYLSSSFDTDRNGYLSDAEIAAVTVMDFIPADSAQKRGGSGTGEFKTPGSVKSLEGLSFFTELRSLFCAGNRLTVLDVSRNTKLEQLYCDDNQIANLDLSSNDALRALSCAGNPLTELDISNCQALVELIENTLPSLDMNTIIFSNEGGYLAFDLGVNLTPAFSLGVGTPIDEENFQDAAFRRYLSAYCDLDRDGTLTEYELTVVKYMDCSGEEDEADKIATLEGIGFFPSLEKLLCGNNLLTALDLSGNPALTELQCAGNRIEQLDLHGNPALRILDCHDQATLTVLDLSGCSELVTLDCSGAGLTSLDLSESTLLEAVKCGDNPNLQALDVSTCEGLQTLSCGNTQIPAIQLSGRKQLTKLDCGNNPALTTVNVSGCKELTTIFCNDCGQLSTLNIRSCEELSTLDCRNGNLTRLNLGSSKYLGDIACYGNHIAAIDLLPSYTLSAIAEWYDPVIENGIAYYNYEGHKISFDAGTVLVYIEPDFILPDSLKTIEDEAFENGAFKHVVLSGETEAIGVNAFAGCEELLCVCIPNGEAQIDSQAFGGRTGIVLFGPAGGTAQTFAQEHNCFFIPID